MKRILFTIITLLMLSSCSLMYGLIPETQPGFRRYGYAEEVETLKTGFPELYELYINGHIIVTDMYEYINKDGETRINVTYHYR